MALQSSPIIITVANNQYSLALAVMLKSIEVNLLNGVKAYIYVLNNGLKKEIKQEIEVSIDSNRLCIKWVKVDQYPIRGLKVNGHIAIDTYYRLLIENYFPQYSKVIYLDADTVVNKSICELWNIEIHQSHLLAVPLVAKKSGYVSGERGLPAYKLLGIPSDTRTFNAGVMVLNLNLWRQDLVSKRVIEYLRKYEDHVLWWDQDGLNAILHENWIALPPKWNVITSHFTSSTSWEDTLLSENEYQETWNSPGIIHYAGPFKPWLPDYEGTLQDFFYNYLNKLSSNYFKALYLKSRKIYKKKV